MLAVLNLFWSFCRAGFTSFGGLSMIPLINGEMGRHGWMTAAFCIQRVRNSPALEHIITGVRPVCLGITCAVLISLGQANYFIGGSLSLKAVLIAQSAWACF